MSYILNKKLLCSLAIAGTMINSTAFASENPFATVPKDYWAYTAVEHLVETGLVDGYNLTDFHDKKVVARYDLAQFVARAMANENRATAEDKVILNKLQQEYSNELKIMMVMPAEPAPVKEEPQATNNFFDNGKIKWFGDARIRYQTNYKADTPKGYTANVADKDRKDKRSNRIQERLRLGFYAEPDENLSVLGRVKLENTTNDDNGYTNNGDSGAHGSANLDLLALTWKQMDTSVTLGRQNLNIGQGLIWWDNPVDGIMVTQDLGNNSLISAGWGNLTAENWKDYSMNAFIANAQIGVDDNTKFTLGYLKTNSNENTLWNNHKNQWNWIESSENPYMLEQIAYGINTQLSDKWNLTAEAVTNRASGLPDGAQKNGWWTRLTYGNLKWDTKDTWKVYADYMSLGNYSVDSTGWAHMLNTPGGDGLGGNGEKGYGLGISYMLADNTNLEFNWYKLRPYDSNYSGFSDYYDMYNLALNYSF